MPSTCDWRLLSVTSVLYLDEKRRLDHACDVVTELLEEDGNGVKEKNGSSELSRPKLIMKILEESPRALRSDEIRDIALKEYGREIPPAPFNSALGYTRRSGRVTNSDGMWTIAPAQAPAGSP